MSSESISDEETGTAIQKLFREHRYISDPHGAVGWLALSRWLTLHPDQQGIFLETAHPVKFPDTVEKVHRSSSADIGVRQRFIQ